MWPAIHFYGYIINSLKIEWLPKTNINIRAPSMCPCSVLANLVLCFWVHFIVANLIYFQAMPFTRRTDSRMMHLPSSYTWLLFWQYSDPSGYCAENFILAVKKRIPQVFNTEGTKFIQKKIQNINLKNLIWHFHPVRSAMFLLLRSEG